MDYLKLLSYFEMFAFILITMFAKTNFLKRYKTKFNDMLASPTDIGNNIFDKLIIKIQ